METRQRSIGYLERLASELAKRDFAASVIASTSRPYLKAANPDSPTLSERIYCQTAPDGSWCFWWPSRQPIGSVDDMETVTGKIMVVLRSVEGTS